MIYPAIHIASVLVPVVFLNLDPFHKPGWVHKPVSILFLPCFQLGMAIQMQNMRFHSDKALMRCIMHVKKAIFLTQRLAIFNSKMGQAGSNFNFECQNYHQIVILIHPKT